MHRQEMDTACLTGKVQLPVTGFRKHLWISGYFSKPLESAQVTAFTFLPFISK